MPDDSAQTCSRNISSLPLAVEAGIMEILASVPRFRSLDPFELRTLARQLDEIADYAEALIEQQACRCAEETACRTHFCGQWSA